MRSVRPWFEKEISGCSLTGFINENGERVLNRVIFIGPSREQYPHVHSAVQNMG